MATTNFVQHNPTAANQEIDSVFDANSLTTGGIGVDAIMPSDWMNKRWYQDSTFVTAFAQMLAAKGYTTSDANVATLASVLANVLTNADQKPNAVNVGYSPTPTFDAAQANGFVFQLAGQVFSSALINVSIYQILTFEIQQLGSFPFAWPSNVHNALQPSPGTDAGVTIQQFMVLGDLNAYAVNGLLNIMVAASNAAIAANTAAIAANTAAIATKQNNLGFTPVHQGGGSGQFNNTVFIGWNNTRLKGQVDGSDLGQFVFDSDMAAYVSAQIAAAVAALPVNLTLTDVTGGRSFNTPFQNNTGHVLQVYVNLNSISGVGNGALLTGFAGPSSGGQFKITCNGVTNSGGRCGVSFSVPAGWWYSATGVANGGSPTIVMESWIEGTLS